MMRPARLKRFVSRALAAWCVVCAGTALADPAPPGLPDRAEIGLRGGDHPGFGRLVLDLPPHAAISVAQVAGGVTVRVTLAARAVWFGAPPRPPRNAGPITRADGMLAVALRPGVALRQVRMPDRLVLDFLDPGHTAPPVAVVRPVPSPATPPAASPASSPVLPRVAPARPAEPALMDAAAGTAAGASAGAIPVDSVPLPQPGIGPGTEPVHVQPSLPAVAARLPVPARAGMAALRRGDVGLLVVEADAPADPAAWRAVPGLEAASVETLAGATLVSFRLPAGVQPVLRHAPQGWTLSLPAGGAASPPAPEAAAEAIDLTSRPQHLLLAAHGASRVVSVADPLGGGTLLVGTIRADAPDALVQATRSLPALTLLPTWRGVAVEPLSDSLDMRPVETGFLLDLGSRGVMLGALPEGGAASAEAADLGRCFDLPPLPVAALMNRQAAAEDAVAASPPRARGAAQLRLAESLVALGLGAEAQAVLRLALAADGRLAADPHAVALTGVAAFLAGRPADSPGLDAPVVVAAQAGAEEIALWRALRDASAAAASGLPAPADAARAIAARQAIVLSYPAPLRDRLLPLMADTLAEAAPPRAAERLIAAAGDAPGLDDARAVLDLRAGRVDSALDRLDRLANLADRRERARAAVRAVEVRLAAGRLTIATAADAMDRLIAAWRGDDREVTLRLRVAELRAKAGQFRVALALLRETRDEGAAMAQAAPAGDIAAGWSAGRLATVRDRLAAVFAQALAQDEAAPIPPLEFVSLVEDNADLLPAGAEGERVARVVADRLAALDLPEQAEAALRRLVDQAQAGPARASLGSALAAMQVREGDAQAALVSLSASTAEGLPAPLVAERTLTYARAAALHGDVDAAGGALAALDTPAAQSLRAELLEKAGRWPAAAAALSRRVADSVPVEGPIGADGAALVLRLASAAAQAGESGILDQLRGDYLPRLPPGSSADMLRVLTEGPVRGVADLPRAAQEAALARSVMR